jgi:hypothetical protein
VGAEFVLDDQDSAAEECRVLQLYGAARLYQVTTPDGRVGVIAIQPDGWYWWVREPMPPEPWSAVQ